MRGRVHVTQCVDGLVTDRVRERDVSPLGAVTEGHWQSFCREFGLQDFLDKHPSDLIVVATHGRLDLMFNNAGISPFYHPVTDTPLSEWDEILRVNVLGAYYTLRAAGAHISHPGGYAVAVSSLGGAPDATAVSK